MDVKSALINGILEEEVYVEQPQEFIGKGKKDYVCLIKKALYGPKQAPRVWKKPTSTSLSQSKHVHKLLKRFNMLDVESNLKMITCLDQKHVDLTPCKRPVGSLIYGNITHPNATYVVGVVSQFMADPREPHFKATKGNLRYLKGTFYFGLEYIGQSDLVL